MYYDDKTQVLGICPVCIEEVYIGDNYTKIDEHIYHSECIVDDLVDDGNFEEFIKCNKVKICNLNI